VAEGTQIELRDRRVAVTGAGGFIGGATCRALADEGAEVIGVEVSESHESPLHEAGFEPRIADVTDRAAIAEALSDAELVVNCAAYVREWGPMEDFIRVNVEGTANVLDAADAAGCERVVQVSSVVVYGYEDESHQDETAFRRTVGVPYIDTKTASDHLATRRGAVIVRPGDVYGPGSVPWTLRPVQLMAARRFAVPNRGDGTMLPVYVDDLVAGILLALRRGQPGRSYTLWDGHGVSFSEYYAMLAGSLELPEPAGVPKALLFAGAALMEGIAKLRGRPPDFGRHGVTFLDRRGTASNQRAREELGWSPSVELPEGIRRSAEWVRAEGILSG
jgi:nucleoside-diphosphate-sugar epimerase